ncbi:winged helix-turn-helix domain-containing protein [Pseudoalteromonas rubra]|uniref:OmpR/PhoB-type domain-containing protein n=1 Tax=Pseudoalteromonas rubra TaxID=43658 RepID=A0A0F4QXS0_9GAMM|nr:winged helix-turn-helix domain-containing protein [Pseudoalteromonas rubra]KJZ11407.1 hypothetical protein TW77_05870 [Pseudoalteromonas rubra]
MNLNGPSQSELNDNLDESDKAQFWLNETRVSPYTGELFQGQLVSRLEPKVMDVLVMLANNANAVLSPQTIFSHVWPRSIYSPVSIRRAISQIRIALNDHDKTVLKTHPKRGYALYADVRHVAERGSLSSEQQTLSSTLQQPRREKGHLKTMVLTVSSVALICIWLFSVMLQSSASNPPEVENIQPLTASPQNEYYSRFTPDSKAIVYLKANADDPNATEIWLTAADRSHSQKIWEHNADIRYFSWAEANPASAGYRLVYAVQQPDHLQFESVLFDSHFQVESRQIHFDLAGKIGISTFVTLGQNVYFLAKHEAVNRIYLGDLNTGKTEVLLSPTEQFNPYRIALSADKNSLTVLGFDRQRHSIIKRFSLTDGKSEVIADLGPNWYFINYVEALNGYLLSDGKHLQFLDESNQLKDIAFENYDFLHFPSVSPNGKLLTFTQTKLQGDAYIHWYEQGEAQRLSNSNRHTWLVSLSPSGKYVTFVSNRNGYAQIFVKALTDGREWLVYANQQQHLALSQPVWNENETKLAFARNGLLTTVEWQQNNHQAVNETQIVGTPTQWLDQGSRILFERKSADETLWFEYAEGHDPIHKRTLKKGRLVVTNAGHFVVTKRGVQRGNGQTIFAAPEHQRIVAHKWHKNALWLLIEHSASVYHLRQISTEGKTSQLIRTLPAPDGIVSDFNEAGVVYSDLEADKDIVTLELR